MGYYSDLYQVPPDAVPTLGQVVFEDPDLPETYVLQWDGRSAPYLDGVTVASDAAFHEAVRGKNRLGWAMRFGVVRALEQRHKLLNISVEPAKANSYGGRRRHLGGYTATVALLSASGLNYYDDTERVQTGWKLFNNWLALWNDPTLAILVRQVLADPWTSEGM